MRDGPHGRLAEVRCSIEQGRRRRATGRGRGMTRADQRQVLEAFSRDYARELHNLLATDLGRFPAFVFQQLYNRLQWRITEGEAVERITKEAARRCAPGRPPWLHLRTRERESEALVRTLAGHTADVYACAFSPDGRRLVSGSWTRPSSSGTQRRGDARRPSKGTTTVTPAPSHPTGARRQRDSQARDASGARRLSGAGGSAFSRWTLVRAATTPSSCGTQRRVLARRPSKDTAGRSTPAPTHPTGAASSPQAATRPSSCGTLRRAPARRASRGTRRRSTPVPSPPTGGASSRRATTRPSSSGTPQRAPARRPSRHATSRSMPAPSRPTGGASSPRVPTRPSSSGTPRRAPARRLSRGTATPSPPALSRPTGAESSRQATTGPSSCGTQSREPVRPLSRGTAGCVKACAFSPDGRRIVSGSRDNTLKLWDAQAGERRADRRGARGSVLACAFSPDGRRLVSASDDGTLKLWDAETGACEATLEGHDGSGQRLRLLARRATHRIGKLDDPRTLGRRDGRLRGDTRGAQRRGQGLRLLARRAAPRLGELRTGPSSSGT